MKTITPFNKTCVAILIFVGSACLMLSYNNAAYGLWISKSPQDLLENSDVIFVGNITSVKVLHLEKQSSLLVNENGIDKNIVENYTLNLDEYTVSVEEFLKNPQNSNKITVRQPTTGLPTGQLGRLDGFEAGDRVLFYVEHFDGTNTYSPESFMIPEPCVGKDAVMQQRLEFGSDFTVIQNGIKVDYGNFTANKPIRFIYGKDTGTLSGKGFDVLIEISKNIGNNAKAIFSKEIHAVSKPCEWIALAEWEFTPEEGNYNMDINIREGDKITDQSHTKFSVRSDAMIRHPMSPLQQLKSGIPIDETQCKEKLNLVIKSSNGYPACIKPESEAKLIERGWAKPV